VRDLAREQTRLLEVIGDDLDEFVLAAGEGRGPLGKAHVEVCTTSLRKLRVGDVPDEDVLEGVFDLAGHRGRLVPVDELAPLQLVEAAREPAIVGGVPLEVPDRTRPESRSHDRRMLGDPLLPAGELVEARPNQRLEARRHRQLARLRLYMPAL
jgi:hypothetical protein